MTIRPYKKLVFDEKKTSAKIGLNHPKLTQCAPALSNQADPLIVCSANTRQGLVYKKGLKGD